MDSKPSKVQHDLNDEVRYRILNLLKANPNLSQRELAAELGVSLGKANYCLQALIARGLVKVRNFRNSTNKLSYAYLLTPKGLEEKTHVTLRFLSARVAEYEALSLEIARLKEESAVAPGGQIETEDMRFDSMSQKGARGARE